MTWLLRWKSPRYIALAPANIQHLGRGSRWSGRSLPMLGDEQFDVLVSNPPYLTDEEYDSLADPVRTGSR